MSQNKRNRLEVKAASGDRAKLNIYGGIGPGDIEAADVIKAIDGIDSPQLDVHVNSVGGSAKDGIAIYNRLRQYDGEVNTIIDSAAWSAASVVALAGEVRDMRTGSTIMIHNAWNGVVGDHRDMRKTADVIEQFSNDIATIYTERTNLSLEQAHEMMDEETWIRGEEAYELGFTTSEPVSAIAMGVEIPSDRLSMFKNIPRDIIANTTPPPVADTTPPPVADTTPPPVAEEPGLLGQMTTAGYSCQDLATVACTDLETVRGYILGKTTPLAHIHFQAFARLPGLGSVLTLKRLARIDGVTF